jgi:hypothetical protein
MKILLVDGTARGCPLGTRNQPDCRNGLQRMVDKRGGQFLVAPDQMCGVEVWRGGLGGTYRLPALSFAGASLVPPCFRFHTPLIEPDVRICRIRLSEKTHAIAVAVHVTLSATSENKSGVARLIAILPSLFRTVCLSLSKLRCGRRNPQMQSDKYDYIPAIPLFCRTRTTTRRFSACPFSVLSSLTWCVSPMAPGASILVRGMCPC